MKSLKFLQPRSAFVLMILSAALAIAAPAQTLTKLADLSTATGVDPATPLTQGLDGNLYGTAQQGGANGGGSFIQVMLSSGATADLYDFCFNQLPNCPDGAYPSGTIALGPDGNFYGTTAGGFYTEAGNGTIYEMTTSGGLTVLDNFNSCSSNCSAFPASGLTLARNGYFYGISNPTAALPSAFDNMVFKISSSGAFSNVLEVCPNQVCSADAGPNGTLLQASGGTLMGPGPGGVNNEGAIYKMTLAGTPTIIYSDCADSSCHDGYDTNAPLAQAAAGNLYGTNFWGGSGANCTATQGCGTAFRVTSSGTFTKLHDFCAWSHCSDGSNPNAVIQATDGNFYGTTHAGGTSGDGTVFSVSSSGHFTLLHTFTGTDGKEPLTGLYQATDGNLYGTTSTSVFRISLGLAPFVRAVQEAGAVGAPVIILGNNLTGATSVTFNGTAAAFSVVSDTEITTTVPAGASTGSIQVVTAGSGTLSSNVEFVVLP